LTLGVGEAFASLYRPGLIIATVELYGTFPDGFIKSCDDEKVLTLSVFRGL